MKVVSTRDYKAGTSHSMGKVEKLTLPSSDVLAYELEGGARVTLRPSGTEPKIKYYFELKETPGANEAMDAARARAHGRLQALMADFIKLAQARGQPA